MREDPFPDPGESYSIIERVGRGKWKTTYRAMASDRATDVALLYSNGRSGNEDFEALRHDIDALMRISRKHLGYAHVAELIGLMRGADGRPFIVEEFLSRPLSRLCPLDDIRKVSEIARDLSIGLSCVHAAGLAHRDIKLDNCGISRNGRAKLFDLGSLTSDFCKIKGNIYTRAPELMAEDPDETVAARTWEASDVWALGATIFALRTGQYPFITNSEFEYRERLSHGVGFEDPGDVDQQKQKFDEEIRERFVGQRTDLEKKLSLRIEQRFSGRSVNIIKKMLSFNPEVRPSSNSCYTQWAEGCVSNTGFGSDVVAPNDDKLAVFNGLIASAEKNDIHLSYNHCERIIQDLERSRESCSEIDRRQFTGLIDKMKELKLSQRKTEPPAIADG